ncbi:hypothetical protein PROFUN_07571 [Planoprotostelium fungivorum]|uniref:Uncharacterized protein n=1 Tax=Planoprotostelium fungivorum TaxID=1890364 RepID=A0A2P6NLT0_9EUKA|nr:hypothetical protein PROFUN_07571 [Planoprotostelium fungivorum]
MSFVDQTLPHYHTSALGSWLFDPLTWPAFARTQRESKLKGPSLRLWIMATVTLMISLLITGYMWTIHHPGYTWPMFAWSFVLSLYYLLYYFCFVTPVNKRITIQPSHAARSRGQLNLHYATLEPSLFENLRVFVLTLHMSANGRSDLLEIPVPDDMIHKVTHWLPVFCQGYTDTITIHVESHT